MIEFAFNPMEAVERLEKEQMPRGQAAAIASLMHEGFAHLVREQQKQQEAAKDQVVQLKGVESSAQSGLADIRLYANDALGRLERKIDSGFAAVDKGFAETNSKIDLLRADMDRRFELVSKEFEMVRQDTNRRFEASQADTDRRFELMAKEFTVVREEIKTASKETQLKVGAMVFAAVMAVLAAIRYLPHAP